MGGFGGPEFLPQEVSWVHLTPSVKPLKETGRAPGNLQPALKAQTAMFAGNSKQPHRGVQPFGISGPYWKKRVVLG